MQSLYMPEDRPTGFQEVEAPIFHDNKYMKAVVVNPMHQQPLTQGNVPSTHFC